MAAFSVFSDIVGNFFKMQYLCKKCFFMRNVITDNIFDGIDKLKEAIESYESGDFGNGSKVLKEASEKVLAESDKLNTDEGRSSMLYGDDRNFGIAYSVFEANMNDLAESTDGMAVAARLTRMIVEDANLKRQFSVYEAMKSPKLSFCEGKIDNDTLTGMYTKAVISENKISDKAAMVKSNDAFIMEMRNAGLNENIIIDEKMINLYESISRLMTEKEGSMNIESFASDMSTVNEHVKSVVESNDSVKENDNIDNIINDLTEDEMDLIEDVASSEERAEEIFDEAKKNACDAIRMEIDRDGDDDGQWENILKEVESKTFSGNTALSDISEMIEIANTIEG